MGKRTGPEDYLPSIGEIPVDLAIVQLVALLTVTVGLVYGLRASPWYGLLGLPLVIFLPGYAIISALYPSESGIHGFERVLLSISTSIIALPLLVFPFNYTRQGIRPKLVLLVILGVITVSVIIAAVRREQLSKNERFSLQDAWTTLEPSSTNAQSDLSETLLTVLVAFSVLVALGSAAFVVAFPRQGENVTELSLLTKNDGGEFVASGYPVNFSGEEAKPVYVRIKNHENTFNNYVLVSKIQKFKRSRKIKERVVFRTTIPLKGGERWQTKHQISPSMNGRNIRLVYLLYRGEPPSNPTVGNAYREVHLWISTNETADRDKARISGNELHQRRKI